ncbi:histone-lysine N-methyltransferase, H3 lysine-79 specific [Aspergillus nidulans var. acristatus]
MGGFDYLQKGGTGFTLQVKKPQIRRVVQTRPAAPSHSANKATPRTVPSGPQKKTPETASLSVSGERDYSPSKRRLTPLRNRKRPTPEQRLSSDDDDGGSDTDTSLELRKRARTGESAEPDYGRRLRSLKAFSGDETRSLPIVHASEITSVQKPGKFKPAFENTSQTSEIFLQYPSATPKESIAKKLDATYRLSLPHVERILTQIYSRTVSPRVDSLRQYENGTDNVYGELLPRFISTIFKETGLKSNHVFVDLGSGVGNVVLQAALEIGCESWGCEMMQNACDLAELQQAEFRARCRLWGIAPGKTHLVRGDFLKEQSIIEVLKRADVVLINNQAFTPQLNNELINHFLDMKEGCQIVSLKSFVPVGHKIQSRNLNSPINLLTVKQRQYWSNSVSWTDVGGSYFIATKDSSRLKAFSESLA